MMTYSCEPQSIANLAAYGVGAEWYRHSEVYDSRGLAVELANESRASFLRDLKEIGWKGVNG